MTLAETASVQFLGRLPTRLHPELIDPKTGGR